MNRAFERWRVCLLAVLLAGIGAGIGGLQPSSGDTVPAGKPASGLQADRNTVFLLQVDGQKNELVDSTGAFKPVVSGGRVVADDRFGKCLQFGDAAKNGISVADNGKMDFKGGFTLETWIWLEEGEKPNPGGTLASKMGSFWFAVKDGKLNNTWMIFPTAKVATSTKTQYDYYPVGGEGFGGAMTIPANRWVHLGITYDQDMKVIRTWIDGGIDRTRYLVQDGDVPLLSNSKSRIEIAGGMKNFRLAGVKLSNGAAKPGPVPAMEVYVNQLPYEGKMAVTFDHIDKSLAFPVEAALLWEYPTGPSSVIKRIILDSPEKKTVTLSVPGWKGALYTLTVKAFENNRMIYSRAVQVAPADAKGRIRVNTDKSISVDGKKIFPLVIYHAFPEDYPQLAAMGFNIIMPRAPSLRWLGFGGKDDREMADIKTCLDAARDSGVYLMLPGSSAFGHLNLITLFRNHPALFAWGAFDEPWGNLDKVLSSYNVVKLLDPDHPLYIAQNNLTRMQETSEGADILASDPYPLPNVSLRTVSDFTKATVQGAAGLKPVWTIVCQYGEKRPDVQELRCMAYLAVIDGANGLGVYAWDDRPDKVKGWYTKDHPEDVKVLQTVIGELKKMEPVLVIPNSAKQAVFTPDNPALHAAIKEANGKIYLLIASDSRQSEQGTLSLPGIAAAGGKDLLGQGKDIEVKAGKISLELPPLGTAAYEITIDKAK